MKREIIACDIDEVLFPFLGEYLKWYNPKHGSEWEQGHFHSYRFEEITGRPVPETLNDIYEFNAKDILHIEPIKEARQALEKLNERFNLVLLTARHPDFKDPVERWIELNFKGLFKSLDMIGYDLVMEKPRTKAEVCKELGASMLIDDSVGHVNECSKQGIEAILFGNYPWNQTNELPSGVTRCEDWQAVLEYFDGQS